MNAFADVLRPELDPVDYWETRALRYARVGGGLAAVCSYGMPRFHNLAIDFVQRLALAPFLRLSPGTAVLDLGCGVGRWSRRLACRGARVTGVDISPTMVAEARERAAAEGLAGRADFRQGDVRALDLTGRFDVVLAVTVLQHQLGAEDVDLALAGMVNHLAPGGRIVLLEAAPSRPVAVHDTAVFRARTAAAYLAAFERAGLRCTRIAGVDPAPFRRWLLPRYPRLRRPLALAATLAATAASLPLDAVFGRLVVNASWHKVFELRRTPAIREG